MKRCITRKLVLLLVMVLITGCGAFGGKTDGSEVFNVFHDNMKKDSITIDGAAEDIMDTIRSVFMDEEALLPIMRGLYAKDSNIEGDLERIDNYRVRGDYFESMLDTYGVSPFALSYFVDEALTDDFDESRDKLEVMASDMVLTHDKNGRLSATLNDITIELEIDDDYLPDMEYNSEYEITDYYREHAGTIELEWPDREKSVSDLEYKLEKNGYDAEKFGEVDVEYIESIMVNGRIPYNLYKYLDIYKLKVSCIVDGVESTRYFIQSISYEISVCDGKLFEVAISTDHSYSIENSDLSREVTENEYNQAFEFVRDEYMAREYWEER